MVILWKINKLLYKLSMNDIFYVKY